MDKIKIYQCVLIADVATPAEFIKRTLKTRSANSECVYTISEAIDALTHKQFDLIVCGMHFDESRMIELLWKVKELPKYENVPFLCVRLLWAHPEFTESVNAAHVALGAAGFVEISNMAEEGAQQLLAAVDLLQTEQK